MSKTDKITIDIERMYNDDGSSYLVARFVTDTIEQVKQITRGSHTDAARATQGFITELEYYLNDIQPNQNSVVAEINQILNAGLDNGEEGLKFLLDVLRFARVTRPENLRDHGIKPPTIESKDMKPYIPKGEKNPKNEYIKKDSAKYNF